jgi:hypothetical protein
MATFNYAMCQQYKVISKNNQNENIYLFIYFLEMHKLCHVAMCNWLLGKFHIVVINCNKLHSQSIWFTIYFIHVHCVNVMFTSCL